MKMDWWKLFAVLVAVTCVHVSADGPKKKIRIHLPQKVKHIHHHKKIYITNHPAHSQYAPAFLPNAEGAVAVPTSVAVPSVANLVPLSSVELYEESQNRLPGIASAASKLLPLYRARGYYGPNHSEFEEQEYDLAPPPEPADSYVPSAFSAPAATAASTPKRVKILKVNETPRKKVSKKIKPKRIITVRNRPQPEEEHPVSSFHEQFYSDLEGSGTIKKIRKPQRVEKIIDGDTEHIHTYSEEHIHKVVFDDGPKLTGVVGLRGHGPRDHLASMSALAAHHPLIPLKNSQTLLALSSDPFTGLTAVGSMGTPSHLEYAGYNPRDVTHDHIFHDHGEITSDIDIIKDGLGSPPKGTYNSQGLRISGSGSKQYKHKHSKPSKPSASTDFSYYESIYSPHSRPKKAPKPVTTEPTSYYETSSEVNYEDYRRIPAFKVKDKSKLKSRYVTPNPNSYYGGGKLADYRPQQASVPAPFSLSSTVVHDYQPKPYESGTGSTQTQTGFTNFKDPFVDFKGYSNNFDYDTYASSSNVQQSETKNVETVRNKKKKSISTQSISFGGHSQHQSVLDHLEDSSDSGVTLEDDAPTSAEINAAFDNFKSSDVPTAYTIKETSPVHQYYTAMAVKALHGDPMSAPAASNDNFQYAEPPAPSTTSQPTSVGTTTSSPLRLYRIQTTDAAVAPSADNIPDTRQNKRTREKKRLESTAATKVRPTHMFPVIKEVASVDKSSGRAALPTSLRHLHRFASEHPTDSSTVRGKLKYGDKI